ncbi:MAG: DUF4116 domain-containing protein [Myxococcaceae bacterium]
MARTVDATPAKQRFLFALGMELVEQAEVDWKPLLEADGVLMVSPHCLLGIAYAERSPEALAAAPRLKDVLSSWNAKELPAEEALKALASCDFGEDGPSLGPAPTTVRVPTSGEVLVAADTLMRTPRTPGMVYAFDPAWLLIEYLLHLPEGASVGDAPPAQVSALLSEAGSLGLAGVTHRLKHEIEAARRDALWRVALKGEWLSDVPEQFRADREVVRTAVMLQGRALRFADPALRADKELVLIAVSRNGLALAHVAPALQEDLETVRAAVLGGFDELNLQRMELHLPVGPRECPDPALRMEILRGVRERMLQQLKADPVIKYAAPSLRANREIVAAALSVNPYSLQLAAPHLQEDKELVRIAGARREQLEHGPLSLVCVPDTRPLER